jgi:transposase
LRKKLPALRQALEGRFDSEHMLVVGQILAHIDFLDESIDRRSAAIEEQIAPFAPAVELLCTIRGMQRRAAEVIIGETGGDMAAFAIAGHLASWAAVYPGNDESAGKRRSGRTRRGSKWLRGTLIEAARAAARTTPIWPPNASKSAAAAAPTAPHSRSLTHSSSPSGTCLQTGETYLDPGGDYYTRRDPARTTRRLIAQLERLGHIVTLRQGAAA